QPEVVGTASDIRPAVAGREGRPRQHALPHQRLRREEARGSKPQARWVGQPGGPPEKPPGRDRRPEMSDVEHLTLAKTGSISILRLSIYPSRLGRVDESCAKRIVPVWCDE